MSGTGLKTSSGEPGRIPATQSGQGSPVYRLSFAQARLWFLDRFQPGNPTYNIPWSMRLPGKVEPAVLERALNEIGLRHASLRTTFQVIEDEPSQVVAPSLDLKLSVVDLRSTPADTREAEAQRLTFEESRTPFDLASGPLIRATLLKLTPTDHVLIVVLHHIVSDGWSMGILYQEIAALYGAFSTGRPSPLKELPIQYGDYANWQREWLSGTKLAEEVAWWSGQLRGLKSICTFPSSRPRPAMQSNRGDLRLFTLEWRLAEQLKSLGQAEGATLFMTALAAFQVLLSRYTGETDIVVGTPIANRPRKETEGLIGFFVNTLVLRQDLSGDPAFRQLLRRVREMAFGAYAHQDMPFEKLVEELQPERDLSHNPLFQVMFAVQNIGAADRSGRSQPDPAANMAPMAASGTSKFDITVSLFDTGRGLQGAVEFNTDLYDSAEIARIVERYQILLRDIVENPDRNISRLALDRDSALRNWNAGLAGPAAGPLPINVGALLAARAANEPEAPALIGEARIVPYEDLNRRTNQLARYLVAAGLRPGELVAIATDRSTDSVEALLAVTKSGAAFVPLDVLEPPGRSRLIVADCGARLAIAAGQSGDLLPEGIERVIRLDREAVEIAGFSAADLDVSPAADDLACILYRSHSGGRPAGVLLSHGALLGMGSEPSLGVTRQDRVAHASSLLDDSSLVEIFAALCAGAPLICLPGTLSPRALAERIRDREITVLSGSLAMAERLAREFPWAFRGLRVILCSDTCAAAARLREGFRPDVADRLILLTGPIEAGGYFAVQALSELPPDAAELPLGRPATGAVIHLLDGDLRPVGEGLWGEVFVGRRHLANGYRSSSAGIADDFTRNPFAREPARLYRTGFFSQRQPGGILSHPVRRDSSLLIRGVRMEAAEIEAALLLHPAVAAAAAIPIAAPARFAAFVSLAGNALAGNTIIEPDGLKSFLQEWLPAGTIPQPIEVLQALPRTADGQLDRRALGTRVRTAESAGAAPPPYVAPRNALEQRIANIWSRTFGREQIGVQDNFFQLGGHSLLATQVAARIADELGVDVPLHRLFDLPTIAEFAAFLEPLVSVEQLVQEAPAGSSIPRIPRDRPVPLSFAQQRVWFLDRFEPGSPFYNIPFNIRLQGPLDVAALRASLNELVRRHEPLRTTFAVVDGDPVQVIAREQAPELPVVDFTSYGAAGRESEAQKFAISEARKPFNLQTGPVFRATLLKLSETDHVLLLVIHHIVADAWSIDVISRELGALYDALADARSADLPELPIQYADFAVWQRNWLEGGVLEKQLAYWMTQLRDAPPVLELPSIRPRPPVQVFSGGLHNCVLPNELAEAVRDLSETEETTVFMTLLAAFDALIFRYTGQSDFVVGTPIANRIRPELEGLIGFFANTLPIRARIRSGFTFRKLLAHVRETTLAAYENQDVPFERLVEELKPARDLARNPVFQVMLAFHTGGSTAAPDAAPLDIGTGIAKFDLTLFITDSGDAIRAAFEYNSDLFEADVVARMADNFTAFLASAVAEPDRDLTQLSLLSGRELQDLRKWNATAAPFRAECIHRMFEAQAERTPGSPAVLFDGRSLSYRELNQRANFWAQRLLNLGLGPDRLAAVALERSPDMIVAVLAALKAGGGYVPIDPSYPSQRIAMMLSDAGVQVVISSRETSSILPPSEAPLLLIENEGAREVNPRTRVEPGHVAYVIYTSGSTGRPKGVAMPHRALANLLQWQIARSALPPEARTLQFAPLSFDVSFQEIFSTLCGGGTLVMIGERDRRDPALTWNLLGETAVNRLFLPYVALQQLADHASRVQHLPASLKEVIAAGEQLRVTPQISSLFARLGCPLYNQYGPTETHVVTELCLSGDPAGWPARPTIGRPIPNATIQILDQAGQPVPVTVPGEVYIGGVPLARGYWRQDDLTASKFSGNAGERLYRTGDIGRYLPDGTIEFLGRRDDQVKLRGFRVEAGEVESQLQLHRAVLMSAAVVQHPGTPEASLAAYVQVAPGEHCTAAELRAHLSEVLPEYMVPNAFVFLDALPLTPSGKVNRGALPAPGRAPVHESEQFLPPRTTLEKAIARIWCEVLRIPKAGVHDNFFELGGQSLVAARMLTRVNDELKVNLPLRRVFEHPTIESLAIAVIQATAGDDDSREAARLIAEVEAMTEEEARELLGET